MADDFVKKAFSDATENDLEKEIEAYVKTVTEEVETKVNIQAARAIGFLKFNKLCEVVLKYGFGEIMAGYAHFVLMLGFQLGYEARKEETP